MFLKLWVASQFLFALTMTRIAVCFHEPPSRGETINLPLGSRLERSSQIRQSGITRGGWGKGGKDETDGEESYKLRN